MAEYDRYYSCARDLKVFTSLHKPNKQFALRQMSNYDLSVFTAVLKEHIGLMQIKTPNLLLPNKEQIKRVYTRASNTLDSIISGLAEKYISKEVARQEIMSVCHTIKSIEIQLKLKANQMKRQQIVDVALGEVDSKLKSQAAFKPIDLADLGDYLPEYNKLTDSIAPIIKKYSGGSPPQRIEVVKPTTVEEEDTSDPYASPSQYGNYLGKFERTYHDAFLKASKQIKIPSTLGVGEGQTLWGLCRLPIYIITNPPLRLNELQRAGIKFTELDKNSFILYNQTVLAIWTKQTQIEYEDTFVRAKKAIRLQLGSDFLYAKPFTSKEVKKPIAFYWMMPPSRLSEFKTLNIGLPFAPELKSVENLTNNTQLIREEREKEFKEQIARSELKKELAKPLIDEFNHIKKQIEDTNERAKKTTREIEESNIMLKQAKIALQSMRVSSKEYQLKTADIMAIELRVANLRDMFINEKKVRLIGLKQKMQECADKIKEFNKTSG